MLACEQADHRRRLRLAHERERRRVDPVRLDQPAHQVGHAAARRADVDAPAGELRQARQLGALSRRCGRVAAIEQPDRLVEQAAERDQAVGVASSSSLAARPVLVGAALHEGDVDARRRAGAGGRGSRPRRRSSAARPRCRSPSGSARSACRTRRRRPGPGRSRGRRGAAASGRAASRRRRAAPTARRMNGAPVATRSRNESRVARSWSRMAPIVPAGAAAGARAAAMLFRHATSARRRRSHDRREPAADACAWKATPSTGCAMRPPPTARSRASASTSSCSTSACRAAPAARGAGRRPRRCCAPCARAATRRR